VRKLNAFGGTLIVAVPCQQGLVICADRLATDLKAGKTEDTQKLFQIGPSAAVGTTGTSTLRDPGIPDFKFDAHELVTDFFREYEFKFEESLMTKLAERLTDRLNDFYSRFTNLGLAKHYVGGYLFIFRLVFAYIDETQAIKVSTADFLANEATGDLMLGPDHASERQLEGLEPMVFGDRAVFDAIHNQTDTRFDEARNDPILNRFMTGNAPSTEVTEEEALEFGKKLITISSQMAPILSGKKTTIGEEIDCAILRFGSGFEWVKLNSPVQPSPDTPLVCQ
jgi:hypothetical protein